MSNITPQSNDSIESIELFDRQVSEIVTKFVKIVEESVLTYEKDIKEIEDELTGHLLLYDCYNKCRSQYQSYLAHKLSNDIFVLCAKAGGAFNIGTKYAVMRNMINNWRTSYDSLYVEIDSIFTFLETNPSTFINADICNAAFNISLKEYKEDVTKLVKKITSL